MESRGYWLQGHFDQGRKIVKKMKKNIDKQYKVCYNNNIIKRRKTL